MKFEHLCREGTSFLRLCDDTYHYSIGYYAANNWLDDDRLLVARSRDMFDFSHAEYVLVDIKNETETVVLDDYEADRRNTQGVVFGSTLYLFISDDLVAHDLASGERRIVLSGKCGGWGKDAREFCITRDGRYLSMQGFPETRAATPFWIIDTQSGAFERHSLAPYDSPFWTIGHVMICPTDPSKVFFCHEGTTQYVSNRLWLWERDRGSRWLVRQRLDEQGNLADCLGHECWAPDGQGLYYVKYPVAGQPPYGIGYVDVNAPLDAPDIRYSAYRYWHVCCSPNGKWLAADTIEGTSGICSINLETGEERRHLHVLGPDRSHPTHPHPCFSPSSSRICFHDYCEQDGTPQSLGIGIIDL